MFVDVDNAHTAPRKVDNKMTSQKVIREFGALACTRYNTTVFNLVEVTDASVPH